MCPILDLLGCSRDEFIANHAGRRLLYAPKAAALRMDLEDAADLLACVRPEKIRVFDSSREQDVPRLRDGSLDFGSIWDCFYGGLSIVVNSVHQQRPEIGRYCRDLSLATGHRVQANVYISPPSGSGFDVHYDTHDVIAIQLHGTKHWMVYDPPEDVARAPGRFIGELDKERLAETTRREIALTEADALYIPRGHPHKAVASADEPSVHLTFGLSPITKVEFLKAMVDRCASLRPELEEPADWNLFFNPALDSSELWEVVAASLSDVSVSTIVERLRRSVLRPFPQGNRPIGSVSDGINDRIVPDHGARWSRSETGDLEISTGIKAVRFTGRAADIAAEVVAGSSSAGRLVSEFSTDEVLSVVRTLAGIDAVELRASD